jgi:hypothetical protein
MGDAAREWIARKSRTVSARRPVFGLLAGGLLRLAIPRDAPGRRKRRKKQKKATLCLDGQTFSVPKKKRGAYQRRGATPGACPPTPPCTGSCAGKPCGADDGCGNDCGCPAGQACRNETCLGCTLFCEDTPAACGAQLQAAINATSFIVACPGRYAGNFQIDQTDVTLVGAGRGADLATSTILDGNRSGRVLNVGSGRTVALEGLRMTGGAMEYAAGIRNEGKLTITRCAVTGNSSPAGVGGIMQFPTATGPLTLVNSTITENRADATGGGLAQTNANYPVTLTNCVVARNHAGVTTSGTGGGIQAVAGKVTVTGGSITGNSADDGGGIFAFSPGLVTLSGVTVSGNTPNQCVNVAGC